jgi:hypothetical protein
MSINDVRRRRDDGRHPRKEHPLRATKLAPMLLVVPVLAITACGGGSSDNDKITKIVIDGGKNPVTICDHISTGLLKAFGSVEKCQAAAKADKSGKDPNVKVDSIDIKNDKATAKITGNQGHGTISFAKQDGDWKVTNSN